MLFNVGDSKPAAVVVEVKLSRDSHFVDNSVFFFFFRAGAVGVG